MRPTRKSRPPLPSIQSSWSASRISVATRRRVVGLVLARVVERRGQRQGLGDPAVGARADLGDALLRGRAQQRQPQAAVGGEALLRREVVDVGLRRVERQAAGAGGRVDEDERVAVAAGRALRPGPSRRSRSRCAPRRRRRRRPRGRRGRVARLGLDDDRVAEERRALGDRRELLGELAEASGAARARGRGRRPRRPRTRSCRRCRARPRSRRAGRRARQSPARTRPTRSLTGFWRCDVPISVAPAVASCGELLGADLRRAAAEAAVGGLELFRDVERRGARRHGAPRSRSG